MALSVTLRLQSAYSKKILIFSDPTLDKQEEEKALNDNIYICMMDHCSNFIGYYVIHSQ